MILKELGSNSCTSVKLINLSVAIVTAMDWWFFSKDYIGIMENNMEATRMGYYP